MMVFTKLSPSRCNGVMDASYVISTTMLVMIVYLSTPAISYIPHSITATNTCIADST